MLVIVPLAVDAALAVTDVKAGIGPVSRRDPVTRYRSAESAEEKKIPRDIPAFRSFRVSFAILLRDGHTMQYASATDPISGEVMRIEVTLSLAS